MMYLRVYGEKKSPKADVVICDSVADVPSRGDGCFSIIPAYYGGWRLRLVSLLISVLLLRLVFLFR